MSKNKLILSPEVEALREKLEEHKAEFLNLFTQHKYMVDDETVILTSLYIKELGSLQHDLLKKNTELSRLNMKIKLIQAAYNRNEMPNIPAIEKKLDDKLKEYYEQINQQAKSYELSLKVLSNLLSDEETKKLKEIFRVLCRRLHPDLNPNLTEEEKDLFVKVQAAYDLNKLTDLQQILLFLDGIGEKRDLELSENSLEYQIHDLKENIRVLEDKISALQKVFPFNVRELLYDDKALSEKQSAIKFQIEEAEKQIDKYNQQLTLMVVE